MMDFKGIRIRFPMCIIVNNILAKRHRGLLLLPKSDTAFNEFGMKEISLKWLFGFYTWNESSDFRLEMTDWKYLWYVTYTNQISQKPNGNGKTKSWVFQKDEKPMIIFTLYCMNENVNGIETRIGHFPVLCMKWSSTVISKMLCLRRSLMIL